MTAIGTASVAHQIAIQTPSAATRHAGGSRPSGAPSRIITIATTGPSARPTFWYPARPCIVVVSVKVRPQKPSQSGTAYRFQRLRSAFSDGFHILYFCRFPALHIVVFRPYRFGTHGDEMSSGNVSELPCGMHAFPAVLWESSQPADCTVVSLAACRELSNPLAVTLGNQLSPTTGV